LEVLPGASIGIHAVYLKITTVSFLMGLAVVVYMLPGSEVDHPPGVLASGEPSQTLTASGSFERDSYRITPLANFRIRGRILLKDRYWLGRESDLSPLDLTLGWGRLSDTAVIEQFSIYRGHRCFYWKPTTREMPVPVKEVVTHIANVHLIPADKHIAESLFRLRKGDVVELAGYLVEANAPDGWHWKSSLTREDSGPGACEVMWVDLVRAE
jgi:hypothetical protein